MSPPPRRTHLDPERRLQDAPLPEILTARHDALVTAWVDQVEPTLRARSSRAELEGELGVLLEELVEALRQAGSTGSRGGPAADVQGPASPGR
jgi:hypothetical protein